MGSFYLEFAFPVTAVRGLIRRLMSEKSPIVDDQHYVAALRRTMNDLTRTFAKPVDIDGVLKGVTAAAVELIESVDCADVLVIWESTEFRSLAATWQLAAEVDDIQEKFHEGPCIDAAQGDALVRCDDLRSDQRWPRFADEAVAIGVLAMMSFQLYTHDKRKGALNLFALQPDAFTAKDQAVGAMLATHAATALIAYDRERQFESAVSSRDIIGQAKGMIMERFAVDAIRAFELLRRLSQSSNTRLIDVAAGLVARGPEPRS